MLCKNCNTKIEMSNNSINVLFEQLDAGEVPKIVYSCPICKYKVLITGKAKEDGSIVCHQSALVIDNMSDWIEFIATEQKLDELINKVGFPYDPNTVDY